MKRFLDVLLSLLAIIFLSPLMLIICLIIICDDGLPVIFRQNRVGKGDELFKIKKFRTMKNGAPNLSTADFEQSDEFITRSGKFLRRTSLDELPQLFNVLAGDMSFIGPRPQQDKEHELKLYNARREFNPTAFVVKPGLCSLAIVKMHRSHDPKEKAFYDSEYARTVSFKTDVTLFFAAFGILLGIRKQDKGK